MESSQRRRLGVLPQNPLAWLVTVAALVAAFAAGTVTARRTAPHAPPPVIAASEDPGLFTELEPPNLYRAIDQLEAQQ